MSYLIDNVQQYEKPWVQLIGKDGNSFAIIGRISEAWKRHTRIENRHAIAKEYMERATSGDRDHLLAMSLFYVNEGKAPRSDECDDETYNSFYDEESEYDETEIEEEEEKEDDEYDFNDDDDSFYDGEDNPF